MKRYSHDSWDQDNVRCSFVEDDEGEWVKYEDVEALLEKTIRLLESKLEELKAR